MTQKFISKVHNTIKDLLLLKNQIVYFEDASSKNTSIPEYL